MAESFSSVEHLASFRYNTEIASLPKNNNAEQISDMGTDIRSPAARVFKEFFSQADTKRDIAICTPETARDMHNPYIGKII